MVPKALGLPLLSALQKGQDAQCPNYCPLGTMTVEVASTRVSVQRPVHVTGYFATNGPVTLADGLVATITGAPGLIDTIFTFNSVETESSTITVCPSGSSSQLASQTSSNGGESGQSSSSAISSSMGSTSAPVTTGSGSENTGSGTSGPVSSGSATSGPATSGPATSATQITGSGEMTSSSTSVTSGTDGNTSQITSTSSTSVTDGTTSSTAGSTSSNSNSGSSMTSGTSASNTDNTSLTSPGISDTSTASSTGAGTSTTSPTSDGSSGSQTTTSGSSTSTCVPSGLPTVCASTLPQACTKLSGVNGLGLVPLVPLCTSALGVFAGGQAGVCLAASIGVGTSGADLVACLQASIAKICISELPSACLAIETGPVAQIPQNVISCTTALGPFAVGTALDCLQQAVQDPLSILRCLRNAIGLGDPNKICPASSSASHTDTSSSTPTSMPSMTPTTIPTSISTNLPTSTTRAGCDPPVPVCATKLPQPCMALSSANGLALVPLVPLCSASLAVVGTADTAACLAVTIGLQTTGSSIVACLQKDVSKICITSLPQACLDIPSSSVGDLPGKITSCTTSLGPFAVGTAAQCLQTALSDPSNVLSCLQTAIGLQLPNSDCSTSQASTSTSGGSSSSSGSATQTSSISTSPTSPTGASSQASSTAASTNPSTTGPQSSSETTTAPASSTATSGTAPATSCTPSSTGPAPSACVTALPQACSSLGSLNGLALVPAIAGCVTALGPFAVGNSLTCLSTSAIGLNTKGSTIVSCLLNSFKSRCITTLPNACTKLATEKGLSLIPDAALCVTALGPFAVGSALSCLATSQITDSTTGIGIVTCLETALGLQTPASGGGGDNGSCGATGPPSCTVTLPSPCSSLKSVNGLKLLGDIPLCLTALGAYGVGNAAQCLATTAISVSTLGTSVVNCLTTALSAQCPKSLPSACTNLQTDTLANLATDIPLCTVALGPYAAGDALKCLSTNTGTGSDIVACLNHALGIIV